MGHVHPEQAEQHLSNREIARRIGVNLETVRLARNVFGLSDKRLSEGVSQL
jgi:hypothetical protein